MTRTPALLTQRSSEPNSDAQSFAASSQAARSRTSSGAGRASPSRLGGVRGKRVLDSVPHAVAAPGELDADRPAEASSRTRNDRRRHERHLRQAAQPRRGTAPCSPGVRAPAGDEAFVSADSRTLIAPACCCRCPRRWALAAWGADPRNAQAAAFGDRALRVGMSGADVRVLNVLVRSKPYAPGGSTQPDLRAPHPRRRPPLSRAARAAAQRRRQRGPPPMSWSAAWADPGPLVRARALPTHRLRTVLRAGTVGLAHKTLPCGTVVAIAYRGRFLVTKVIHRGPYNRGYTWDLAGPVGGPRCSRGDRGRGQSPS